MKQASVLPAATAAVEVLSERLTRLFGGLVSAETSIEGSTWSVREAAAHLIRATTLGSELACGAASPVSELTPSALAKFNAQRLADIADTEPNALAKSITTAIDQFVEATARRGEATPIAFHAGIHLDLGQLTCVLAGEYLLHGYDIARAASEPWPIDPTHATLVLQGYLPLIPHITNPETIRGQTATYRLELGAAGALTARFANGALDLRPDPTLSAEPSQVDCVITADPVAYLLVTSGRLSRWAAFALGLMTTSGPRPELGRGFDALFRYP